MGRDPEPQKHGTTSADGVPDTVPRLPMSMISLFPQQSRREMLSLFPGEGGRIHRESARGHGKSHNTGF